MAQRKAYAILIQAEPGLISIPGTTEDPVKTGISTADIAAGMCAAQSVLAALLRRTRTGEGATIEMSMREPTVEWMGHPLQTRRHTGQQPPRMRVSHPSIAPHDYSRPGTARCSSACRATTAGAIWSPRSSTRPSTPTTRPSSSTSRESGTAPRVTPRLPGRTRERTTADSTRDWPAPPARLPRSSSWPTLSSTPQLRARDRWRTIGTEFARVKALLPRRRSATSTRRWATFSALGQHTERVLLEAGLAPATADRVLHRGVSLNTVRRRRRGLTDSATHRLKGLS